MNSKTLTGKKIFGRKMIFQNRDWVKHLKFQSCNKLINLESDLLIADWYIQLMN